MTFQRFGRSHHLVIKAAEDLSVAAELDEALWIATSAPAAMMNCDPVFLKLIDTDSNGRIMRFEVKEAICWLLRNLRDTSGVAEADTSLRLEAINTDEQEGSRIYHSALKILERLGLSGLADVTLENVRRVKTTVEKSPVSESGVVLPEAPGDGEVGQFITDIIATVGGASHPSGRVGIGKRQLDEFLTQAKACLDWRQVETPAAEQEQQAGVAVKSISAEKLRRYLEGNFRSDVESLIAKKAETASMLADIRLVEKLILYQAHLLELANNFISFPYLYDPASRAMFEMGTLVMDGRRFDLSVRVDDRDRHSIAAKAGNMFVLYIEVIPAPSGEKYELAVPVTSGGKGNLYVGKRGVFEDIIGNELDAQVVGIVENPISLREALVSPFRRLGRVLSGKIEAITAVAEKKLDATGGSVIERVGVDPPAAVAAQPSRGLLAGGLLMGGGVAIAALSSAVVYIGKTLEKAENLLIVFAVIGAAILAVILPTAILAILKLRRRDLSAILEGSGWAINTRMRLTFRQGRSFTRRPGFPKGTRGLYHWWRWLLLAVVIAMAASLVWYLRYQ